MDALRGATSVSELSGNSRPRAAAFIEDSHGMVADSSFELLLVEDNSADAGLIQAHLRVGMKGVEVVRVDRLSTAVDALATGRFSVVLLDLNLPDCSGVETFHRLAAKCNGTPIVVLSGMEDAETAIEAVGAGADDYVQKTHYDAQTLARSVRFAMERSTRRITERELINARSELAAAQRIQDSMYPGRPPEICGLDIASGIRSAGIGCGDYYDFIQLQDGRHLVAIGDVSGHGMASAIVMAETRACLHTLTDVKSQPSAMLSAMNRLIYASTSDEMFVTLLLVIYDPKNSTFEYFNAGHPGWVMRKHGPQQLTTHQLPIGLIAELDYSQSDTFRMATDDILVIPTDGIAETPSGSEMFGNQRLLSCISDNRHHSAAKIVENLFTAAMTYAESDVPADDMTVVVMKAE
ncbi:Phosphoserine phosphatase RsbU [Fuerstiella marisgermanici]|uniref:Phosphoserine phosphatase RsbU n=2 Tax=Fuerstiella marisgermanici TaxID=1891926 RepID=A0A1P8WDQ9_9PLAN|nr:Phosphoserine phosphatase RsbU [Fuerstiella marisgermanici]